MHQISGIYPNSSYCDIKSKLFCPVLQTRRSCSFYYRESSAWTWNSEFYLFFSFLTVHQAVVLFGKKEANKVLKYYSESSLSFCTLYCFCQRRLSTLEYYICSSVYIDCTNIGQNKNLSGLQSFNPVFYSKTSIMEPRLNLAHLSIWTVIWTLLECFVFKTQCLKTNRLWSIVRNFVRRFKCLKMQVYRVYVNLKTKMNRHLTTRRDFLFNVLD